MQRGRRRPSRSAAIDFLRRHPRDHLRIVPGTSTLVPRGPENPGHLCLFPFLMGLVVFVVRPQGPPRVTFLIEPFTFFHALY